MPNIDVTKTHKLPLPEAKTRAQAVIAQLKAASWCKDAISSWAGDTVSFEIKGGAAKGVKGNMAVHAGSVVLHLELPLLIGTVWGKTIREEIDNYFASAGLA